MMMMRSHRGEDERTSTRSDHATPWWFFNAIDKVFHFTIDAAASSRNTKCKRFYTKRQNALLQSFKGEIVWCNPPYERGALETWLRFAWESCFLDGANWVLLIPSRTGAGYTREWASRGEIWHVPGRLNFDDGKDPALFASSLVVFEQSTVAHASRIKLHAYNLPKELICQ